MKTIEVKTNIMCDACVAKVTPTLTKNPKKVLSVSTEVLNEDDVIEAVEKAGYKAERIS